MHAVSPTQPPEAAPGGVLNDDAGPGPGGGGPGDGTPAALPEALRLQLQGELEKAQRLLLFATESGVDVGDEVRKAIIGAATTPGGPRTAAEVASLLAATAKLSAAVRPVTAESLQVCEDSERVEKAVKVYSHVALWLALFIVPFSLLTFVTASISDAMMKDIDSANALAVKLTTEIGPPGPPAPEGKRIDPDKLPHDVKEVDVIRDLQLFAATARAADARARQLRVFVPFLVDDPFNAIRGDTDETRKRFELPSDLPNLSAALTERISVYQEVRYFAQNVSKLISTAYGAIGAGILPVLYALLGACAYLLRMYQEQIKSRTFTGNDYHLARFLIAGIGGSVVGLFKNFAVGEGAASISPLAIAFLVGYAADVFFSFLDSFVQTFNRNAPKTPPK